MAYSTTNDLLTYIPAETIRQLSDDNDDGQINNTVVTACISRADDQIDGYLRGRYTVPLTTVPPMLEDLSTRLSAYYLFKRSLIVTMPEPIKDDYDVVLSMLRDIQKGRLSPMDGVVNIEPTWVASNKKNVRMVSSQIGLSQGLYPI